MMPKSALLLLTCPLSLVACTTVPSSSADTLLAQSVLTTPSGTAAGMAEIRQSGSDILMIAKVSGLTPGQHGIHLHQTGKCEGPGFTTAGGHLNPSAHQHGTMNPAGPHLGDLPNIAVGPDGTGSVSVKIAGSASETIAAIKDSDGTAVVVHAGPDDYVTDPSGNSGGRVACGVLASPAN